MKRFKSIVLFLALICSAAIRSHAYSIVVSNEYGVKIFYNYLSPTTLEVTYASGNFGESYSGWIEIPSKINYLGKVLSVVRIGKNAFRECPALYAVILPTGIEEIGDNAFEGCVSLERVELPATLKYIGRSTFRGCNSLSTITSYMSTPCAIEETGLVDRSSSCTLLVPRNAVNIYKTTSPWSQFRSIEVIE